MAQLLLIKMATEVADLNDIVGIYDDKHKFSDEELRTFNVQWVKGSAKDVRKKLSENKPRCDVVYKSASSGKWTLWKPADVIEEEPAWQNSQNGKWYFFKTREKFRYSLNSIGNAERVLLETVLPNQNHPAKDIVYSKMAKKDLSKFAENNIEIEDLNNG